MSTRDLSEVPADAVKEVVDRAFSLPGVIARELDGFGGILRCHICGREEEIGDIANHLSTGWPMCHGETMLWVTARQLAEAKKA